MKNKKCSRCKKIKDVSEFYGSQHRCKICSNLMTKQRVAKSKKEGKCWHCGKKQPINPKTGKPFSECKYRQRLRNKNWRKKTEEMHEAYLRNLMRFKNEDNLPEELINLKREHLRLFRISRGGKRYEKYV